MLIPIEGIWSDIQARVGTLHTILRYKRSKGGGGSPHIPIEEKTIKNLMRGRGCLDGSL